MIIIKTNNKGDFFFTIPLLKYEIRNEMKVRGMLFFISREKVNKQYVYLMVTYRKSERERARYVVRTYTK